MPNSAIQPRVMPAGLLPGPRGLPLLGSALRFSPARAHQVLEDWALEYGPFFQFRLGPRVLVGVTDAEAVRTILRERPEKYTRTVPMEEIFLEMGIEGVFPVEGEQWQRQRRVWIKAMNAHRVRPFFARMTEVTARLQQRWEAAAAAGVVVDVVADLMRFTVDVTTLFAYGYDANTLQKGEDVVQKHLQHVFPAINRRLNSPFPYWRYLPLPADFRLKKALKALESFVMARINETRVRMQQSPELRDAPGNLLEGLIAAGDAEEQRLTDQEIYGNTIGVMLAGEDTTAYTIAWMIHELMQHPSILQRLRTEVDQVLPHGLLWSELERGNELVYLDAVMKEALRLRPVAPISGATAKVDVMLGGRRFPAGTHFIIPLRVLALDENTYAGAREFRPERWLQDTQGHFAQQAPHPFGGGKRTCPGMNLALLEIKSVIAMLLRNFEFEPAAGGPAVREKFAFTMFPEHLRMRLKSRAQG